MLNRRAFLRLAVVPALGAATVGSATATTRFIACRTNDLGEHFATLFNSDGEILWNVSMPSRGHDITVSPNQKHALVFARRPERFIFIIQIDSGKILNTIHAPENRHFYGHGVFANGLLYTTENDFHAGEGVVGVYDAADDYSRVSEFHSGGVGPHQIKCFSDNKTLVVANGGIQTHPDFPKVKLNLDSMAANLAYINSASGEIVSIATLPKKFQLLSIRHIDVDTNDRVAIGMQFQGARIKTPPLVALHQLGGEVRLLSAPPKIQRRMNNYTGSVAFSKTNANFTVSSPRGNLLTHWRNNGEYLGMSQQPDVSGLAANAQFVWASDGEGGLKRYQFGESNTIRSSFDSSHWDNHLTVIV